LRLLYSFQIPPVYFLCSALRKHNGTAAVGKLFTKSNKIFREVLRLSISQKNRGSRITAAELRLPAKGGLTRFVGAAAPLGCAAWTLLFPQP